MDKEKKINVLSLGGGWQSSCILLMAHEKQLDLNCAIFADTGNEPKEVYDYLEYLQSFVDVPIYIVKNSSIKDDIYDYIEGKKKRIPSIPFFTNNINKIYHHDYCIECENNRLIKGLCDICGFQSEHEEKQTEGRLWRQCTEDYKIKPVRRKLAQLKKDHNVKKVNLQIGISLDEFERMRKSKIKYITNVYPLIDMKMSREDCYRWVYEHGYKPPVKSSCVFCPYHTNHHWKEMKKNNPVEFQEACKMDKLIRNYPKINNECFVHRSKKPLEDAINEKDDQQFFDYDIENCGMCDT